MLAAGCSTDPAVNWEKLDQYVIVQCKLRLGLYYHEPGQIADEQHLILHRLRPLVGVAFDTGGYNLEGLTGANVQVSGDSTLMIFQDMGMGRYFWSGDSQLVFPGGNYRLDIVLPDGRQIYSEIVAPGLTRWEGADTIWVEPDSITAWDTGPNHYPVEVNGPGYSHQILYGITPGSELVFNSALGGYHEDILRNDLWFDFVVNDSAVQILTATAFPSTYMANFLPVELTFGISVRHQGEYNLDFALWDDPWPIENLPELSNVTGAYGFFTTDRFSSRDTCVVALRRNR